MKTQKEIEYENSLAGLQRKWHAYREEGIAVDVRSLIEETTHLERITGMQPGTLLNRFRRGTP